MSLRRRVALELATLAVLTPVFLMLVPERPVWVDAGLGLVALPLVTATARTTREQVWASSATPRRERLRHCSRHMLVGTLAVTLLFAVVDGWAHRPAPLYTTTMPAALVLFILWATLQQVLFQFYLLGRLRALISAAPALAAFLSVASSRNRPDRHGVRMRVRVPLVRCLGSFTACPSRPRGTTQLVPVRRDSEAHRGGLCWAAGRLLSTMPTVLRVRRVSAGGANSEECPHALRPKVRRLRL